MSQSSFGRNPFGTSSFQGLGGQSGSGLQGMSSFNSGFSSSSSQHGAAIESLTLTAQSVGLSIEQLAAALSSSPNLKSLSPDAGNQDSQKELALSLYRTESLALYRRCMLLAGFDASSIEETSPEYLEFAFKAWQEEGKRLQDLMGTDMNLQAPGVANLSQQQQEAALAQAQARVQEQVQARAVQAQSQALALEQQQFAKSNQQELMSKYRADQRNSTLQRQLLEARLANSDMTSLGMNLLNNNKGPYL